MAQLHAALSKQAHNPVTLHVALPLHYAAHVNDGPYKATKNIYELDWAVLEFLVNHDGGLITRTKLPAIPIPRRQRGSRATNQAPGVNEWGSGVSAALLKTPASPWEFGVVVNHIW